MTLKNMNTLSNNLSLLITAGSTYLDIDAYACIVAMAELMRRKGKNAVAYSKAPRNYSVCGTLLEEGQIISELPLEFKSDDVKYIIVDVSDPEFLKSSIPLEQVTEIYDHHVGFEEYWKNRIGGGSHIEFIGAAATLIYREWEKANLHDQMTKPTALLLTAAILDNTLNLTSSNTTPEDIATFEKLCRRYDIDEAWRAAYFSEVQANVEADLKNALLGDIKTVRDNPVLPPRVAQICVWNSSSILSKLSEIRALFVGEMDSWMINVIDVKQRCSYFICEDEQCQKKIEQLFDVSFCDGFAKTQVPYLRKEIIKKTLLV